MRQGTCDPSLIFQGSRAPRSVCSPSADETWTTQCILVNGLLFDAAQPTSRSTTRSHCTEKTSH